MSGLPNPRSITSTPARRKLTFSASISAKAYGGSAWMRRNSMRRGYSRTPSDPGMKSPAGALPAGGRGADVVRGGGLPHADVVPLDGPLREPRRVEQVRVEGLHRLAVPVELVLVVAEREVQDEVAVVLGHVRARG